MSIKVSVWDKILKVIIAVDYRPTLSGAERREYIYNGMVLGQQRSCRGCDSQTCSCLD